MTDDAADGRKTVRCRCGPLDAEATYEVSGPFLVLDSPFGSMKAVLGLQAPNRLAAKMLRNRCEKQATDLAKQGVETTASAG